MKKGKSRNKRKKTRSRLLWIAIAVIGIAAVISVYVCRLPSKTAICAMFGGQCVDIVNASCEDLDIRGVSHRGYFAAISDFNSYYESNLSLTDIKTAQNLFVPDWPIYTKTNDSCPTQYFETGTAKNSVVSNGCLIEGEIDHSVIGRGCIIKKGAVVKNCIVLSDAYIGENVHVENQVIDKHAKITHAKELSASEDRPGYVRRNDTL